MLKDGFCTRSGEHTWTACTDDVAVVQADGQGRNRPRARVDKSHPLSLDLLAKHVANIQDMIRGDRRAPDTTNSRADLDLLGEVIRAWSGLRPRCDPFRKRERCVVLMEGISGERHLHANVARFGQLCALRKRGASRVDR